jgi:hypothetical protein
MRGSKLSRRLFGGLQPTDPRCERYFSRRRYYVDRRIKFEIRAIDEKNLRLSRGDTAACFNVVFAAGKCNWNLIKISF